MNIRVLFFAQAREIAGQAEVSLDIPEGATVSSLARLLKEEYPGLANIQMAFAVNHDYVDDARELRGGDEVAIIPPVSGG